MLSEKLHAACDECRTRKLKCSGASPTCLRCERENIRCHYSPQKPMGRPRKRRREDVSLEQATDLQSENPPDLASPDYNDIGLISPSLDDFSGYGEFHAHDAISNGLLPTHFPETSLPDHFDQSTVSNLDFDVDQIGPAMDPSLWQQSPLNTTVENGATSTLSLSQSHQQTRSQPGGQTLTGPCTCFSIMFLTISDLQSMTNLSFPAVVPRLRQAMSTAAEIINCERCPTETFTTIQNVQSVTAVLSALAERFHKVLTEIEREAQELEDEHRKKPFKVGDVNPENLHLHTGTFNCPMSFDVQLEPSDWKKYAKQGLKQEVLGGGQNKIPFIDLLTAMEMRQHRWHSDKNMYAEDRLKIFGPHTHCVNKGDAMCLKMVNQVKRMIDNIDWD